MTIASKIDFSFWTLRLPVCAGRRMHESMTACMSHIAHERGPPDPLGGATKREVKTRAPCSPVSPPARTPRCVKAWVVLSQSGVYAGVPVHVSLRHVDVHVVAVPRAAPLGHLRSLDEHPAALDLHIVRVRVRVSGLGLGVGLGLGSGLGSGLDGSPRPAHRGRATRRGRAARGAPA